MSGDAHLVDTNVLIDYLDGAIPEDNHKIDDILRADFTISVITKIEFLGWTGFLDDSDELKRARSFVEQARVLPLSDPIAERAIDVRQRHGVPLADSVIGATALHVDATLVTRNTADFEAISSLNLYNLTMSRWTGRTSKRGRGSIRSADCYSRRRGSFAFTSTSAITTTRTVDEHENDYDYDHEHDHEGDHDQGRGGVGGVTPEPGGVVDDGWTPP